jgi:hypothetical protein
VAVCAKILASWNPALLYDWEPSRICETFVGDVFLNDLTVGFDIIIPYV